MKKAFDSWSIHTGLEFEEIDHDDENILIKFASGYHTNRRRPNE